MEKLKQLLLSTNFIVSVFVLIGLRVTVVGASIGDALAIIGVSGLYGFNTWLESQKELAKIKSNSTNDVLQKEVEDIKNHMSALMIKNSLRPSSPVAEAVTAKKFF